MPAGLIQRKKCWQTCLIVAGLLALFFTCSYMASCSECIHTFILFGESYSFCYLGQFKQFFWLHILPAALFYKVYFGFITDRTKVCVCVLVLMYVKPKTLSCSFQTEPQSSRDCLSVRSSLLGCCPGSCACWVPGTHACWDPGMHACWVTGMHACWVAGMVL